MEPFILAAVSLVIALSLLARKEKETVQRAFAALCLAVFVQKSGEFFGGIFQNGFWKTIGYLGLLTALPLLMRFEHTFLKGRTFVGTRDVVLTSVIGSLFVIAFFTPLYASPFFNPAVNLYASLTLLYGYVALLVYIRRKSAGVERKRMIYVAIACAVTAFISISDALHYLILGFPPFSNLAAAALLYFILVIIVHPHLPEFYEIMGRALVIVITSIIATVIFYLVIGLFGTGPAPHFMHVLMGSFLIVLLFDPIKLILKKVFIRFFPDAKDFFTSLYAYDQEMEKEKSMLLEEMATALAHEIRNPLGSIKGAGQYLKAETSSPENQKLLDVIIEETDRLNSVVSQFMNYAKPYGVKPDWQDINAIIEKAASLIRANERSGKIIVETELHPSLPRAHVDGEQMMQVILNIAFNGIEAMPEGGTLTLRTSRIESDEGDAVGISIRDTGKGISREDMPNIFKPFFTTKKRGVGLGLAICRKIIRGQGGQIRAKSLPGQGTIFHIRIPVPPE
ncbi:MAG TPA: ATP-binding protein [Syntrophales bacterium]|nr:ATP-binding protein [Syntrophales bacterium]HOX93480.1 ATP-binding protein [Syntrophales bacterium]HPI57550.1 ATP-binding protein [Syntrophales bacterium]HPN24707.1 ATP-binding protein [Syntrophales bacterium]HQM29838.1 ATP-binding protein [Syntrophales bacterium]